MSKAKWTGTFAYSANDLSISGVMPKINIIGLGSESVPISYFSVTGGANRKSGLSRGGAGGGSGGVGGEGITPLGGGGWVATAPGPPPGQRGGASSQSGDVAIRFMV